MDANKFEKLPTSVLTDVSQKPDSITPATPDANNATGKDEILATGEHTKEAFSGASQSPLTPSGTTVTTNPAGKTSGTSLGKLVQGKFAIGLIDTALPSIIVLAVTAIGYKIDKQSMKLTKDEKELLEPAMQQALDAINLDFNNPFINLAVVFGVVYGSKVIDKLPEIKKVAKTDKNKVDAEETETLSPEVANEQAYNEALDKEIAAINKTRKKGYQNAKEFLFKNKPNVVNTLKKKYNIK